MAGDKREESEFHPPVDNPSPPDAAERAIFAMALKDGAFGDALLAYQRGQVRRVLAMLDEENYSVTWHKQPESGRVWASAMVAALDERIEADGDPRLPCAA